jgi:hypothetical protein
MKKKRYEFKLAQGLSKGLDGGTTKEPHICVDTGKPTNGYLDFDPWIADGATRENMNGKGAGRRRA